MHINMCTLFEIIVYGYMDFGYLCDGIFYLLSLARFDYSSMGESSLVKASI